MPATLSAALVSTRRRRRDLIAIPPRWPFLRLGLPLIGILLWASTAQAGIVDLTWNAPTTNADGNPLTDLASYKVYYGTSNPATCPGGSTFVTVPSPTTSPTPGTTVNYRLTGLQTGTTYYVGVTAVDTSSNESACSNQASGVAQIDFTVSPTGSTGFGTVSVGSSADPTFTVQNTAGGTVSGSVTTSAPFSVVSGSPFTLVGAGASQSVLVRFSPTTAGTSGGNVNFTANGGTVSRAVTGTGSTLTLTSLTADRAAPQPTGTTITFTATASGGTAPYQYKWWLYDGMTWNVTRDWNASNTYSWTPSTPNANYQVGVWVRSAGNTADNPEGRAYQGLPFAIGP